MTIFITSNHKMIARPALLILSLEICQICRILQRCKVSSVSLHQLRRKCACMTFGQRNRQSDFYIPPKKYITGRTYLVSEYNVNRGGTLN